jgi:hypothetical protein
VYDGSAPVGVRTPYDEALLGVSKEPEGTTGLGVLVVPPVPEDVVPPVPEDIVPLGPEGDIPPVPGVIVGVPGELQAPRSNDPKRIQKLTNNFFILSPLIKQCSKHHAFNTQPVLARLAFFN